MVFYNHYLEPVANVDRLGFPNTKPEYIPIEYLNEQIFCIFRTCHSYGDWVILSAMPRLIKQKYPNSTVIIPSPKCLSKYFNEQQWQNKHENPFNNVIEVFENNPWVDGMIDEIPAGMPLFHDHFRIYDETNPHIPLVKQILKYWRFEEHEMIDCEPELYWSDDEVQSGNKIINEIFGSEEFGFLYIDDTFFYQIKLDETDIQRRRNLIPQEIDKHKLTWLYFSGNDTFRYDTTNKIINIKDINMTLRIQNYIKSKSKLIIGHQGGYGTDCMSRYTNCYVVPLTTGGLNEHIQLKTTYLC